MKLEQVVIYRCDRCYQETQTPISSRWFELETLGSVDKKHLCKKCGHDFMRLGDWLKTLDIQVMYTKVYTEHDDNPQEIGKIVIKGVSPSLHHSGTLLITELENPFTSYQFHKMMVKDA